jgi:hypothetical protein
MESESSSATVDDEPSNAACLPRGEEKGSSEPIIGICCSGGGIRSAAFNLGALQTLQNADILARAAYLSAVSGGSYIATSMALVRASKAVEATTETQPGSTRVNSVPMAFEPTSVEEEFLRNNSSYLAPGLTGKARLLSQVVGGLVLNFGMALTPLFVVAVYGGLGYRVAFSELTPDPDTQDPATVSFLGWTWPALIAVGGLFFFLSLSDLIVNWKESKRKAVNLARTIALAILVALSAILVVIPVTLAGVINLLSSKHRMELFHHQATWVVLEAGLLVLLVFLSFAPRRYRSFALGLASMAGSWLLLAAIFLVALAYATSEVLLSESTYIWMLLPLAVLWFLFFTVDLVQWSPHPFYVRRLASAFGLQKWRDTVRAYPFDQLPALSSLATSSGPTLLICAAAAVSEGGKTPPGRSCMSLVMSPEYIEVPALKVKMETQELEYLFKKVRGRQFTAMTAAAVSGAALSPTMGRMTRPSLTLLLGLANIRLGMWMPNPAKRDWWQKRLQELELEPSKDLAISLIFKRPRGPYLLRELSGRMSLEKEYLYVTDGGHYENLGLVELLRRRCRTIYCFDATGAATAERASALDIAIATARSDLGVDIAIDPSPILVDSSKELSKQDHVLGCFRYLDGTEGTLVYVRAAVTASTPWDVRQFRKRDRRFPNHSTFNQLFNEEKFEAYRALGAHAARQAIATMQEQGHLARSPAAPAKGLTSAKSHSMDMPCRANIPMD